VVDTAIKFIHCQVLHHAAQAVWQLPALTAMNSSTAVPPHTHTVIPDYYKGNITRRMINLTPKVTLGRGKHMAWGWVVSQVSCLNYHCQQNRMQCHVTIFCNTIGSDCTAQHDKARTLTSPDFLPCFLGVQRYSGVATFPPPSQATLLPRKLVSLYCTYDVYRAWLINHGWWINCCHKF